MKILRYVCMAAVVLGAASCQKGLMTYDEGKTPDIYFQFAGSPEWGVSDSTNVSILLGEQKIDEKELVVNVAVTGGRVGHVRTFKLEPVTEDIVKTPVPRLDSDKNPVLDDKGNPIYDTVEVNHVTARYGTDYEFGECVVPADSLWGTATIKFKRTPELDDSGAVGLRAMFKLVPSEDFTANFIKPLSPAIYAVNSQLNNKTPEKYYRVSAVTYKVTFRNDALRSGLWNSAINPSGNSMINYFGEENVEKINAFIEYGGYTHEDFYPDFEYVKTTVMRLLAGMPSTLPPATYWSMYVTYNMADYGNNYGKLMRINQGLAAYKATHGGKDRTYVDAAGVEKPITLGEGGKQYF